MKIDAVIQAAGQLYMTKRKIATQPTPGMHAAHAKLG